MARLFMLIMLSAALLVAPARAVTIRDFGYFVRDIKLKTSIASDTCARPTGRGGGPSAAHLCLLNLTSMPKSIVWTKILPIGRKPALTVGANSFACKEFTINLRVEFLFRDHKGAEISRNVMSLNDFGGDRVTFEWTVTRQAKINACIAQHCTPLVAAGGGTRANERSSSQLGLAGIFCVAVCNSKY